MARAWPGHDESICVLVKSPEDSSWLRRTGVEGTLRAIVEGQPGEGGWDQIGRLLNFTVRCLPSFA